jgi:hypothetical protein
MSYLYTVNIYLNFYYIVEETINLTEGYIIAKMSKDLKEAIAALREFAKKRSLRNKLSNLIL